MFPSVNILGDKDADEGIIPGCGSYRFMILPERKIVLEVSLDRLFMLGNEKEPCQQLVRDLFGRYPGHTIILPGSEEDLAFGRSIIPRATTAQGLVIRAVMGMRQVRISGIPKQLITSIDFGDLCIAEMAMVA